MIVETLRTADKKSVIEQQFAAIFLAERGHDFYSAFPTAYKSKNNDQGLYSAGCFTQVGSVCPSLPTCALYFLPDLYMFILERRSRFTSVHIPVIFHGRFVVWGSHSFELELVF